MYAAHIGTGLWHAAQLHIVEERSDGFGPSRTVGYFLVEICKMFHKKKKHVKCNAFGPVLVKIIRFA